ncbi:SEC14-like protein 2 [Araneus ventricosus]|uniref:SEC14-like protein 2 n=1 Tax=Araneus ventricosus TaxID=182803 RepID=A0A4Y2NGS1_ARAVE|nr:SEC14-like protein 2 [Araneus ventricosus]
MDNITQEEKNVVDELRKRTINDMTSKLLEDDSVFYRFAKARDFDLVEAEAMLRKHIAWRKEWKIDSILTEYEPPEVLLKYYSSSFLCFDKEGSIVRFSDIGRVDAKGLCNSASKTEMGKFCVYLAELDKASVIKRGGNLGRPIFSPIYDFEDLTYAKAVNVKGKFDSSRNSLFMFAFKEMFGQVSSLTK